MLNKDSHESDEPEINSLSDEEEHDCVCSEISNTVPVLKKERMKNELLEINPKSQTYLLAETEQNSIPNNKNEI